MFIGNLALWLMLVTTMEIVMEVNAIPVEKQKGTDIIGVTMMGKKSEIWDTLMSLSWTIGVKTNHQEKVFSALQYI